MPADELERALHEAHGCRRACPACRRMRRKLAPPRLSRFAQLVAGESGLRFAVAHARHGIPFPPFSDDPYEQWLVEEALLLRLGSEAESAQEHAQARDDARAEAERRLEEHRRTGA